MSEQALLDRLPSTRRGWAALMSELGIRPSKGLGQHFLYERGIVQRMVRQSGVGPDDTVVEIGPGLGILTSELLLRAGQVITIERDRQLVDYLTRTFGDDPRFHLVAGDALTYQADALVPAGTDFAIVANLPYSAGSAIVRHFLEQSRRPRRLTIMLQLEVAERMVARPPEMSVLGVATQFYTSARIAFHVPPTVFLPPPTVESAVAILDLKPELPLPDSRHADFFRIVNAGFRQKRKQVANSLAAELRLSKPETTDWLEDAGIDPQRRAQTLTVEEWVHLTEQAPAAILDPGP